MSTDPDRPTGPAEVVLVVTLGKSTGASIMATGLAVATVTTTDRKVVLAELDPAGGDLIERIVFDGRPSSWADVPPGARELTDHLDAAALSDPGDGAGADGGIRPFLVSIGNVPGLAVLLGDPLVGGARRAAEVIGPELGRLVGETSFGTVVVDGGQWTSADPGRLDGVDLVYAIAEGSSASQNHRCAVEAQAMWRLLRARNPSARMVVTVTRPAWPVVELLDLYRNPPGSGEAGYRVVVFELDNEGEQAATRLARGRWAGIDPEGLAPFVELAGPIGARPRRPPPPEPRPRPGADEYAWVDATPDRSPSVPPPRPRPAPQPTWPFGDVPAHTTSTNGSGGPNGSSGPVDKRRGPRS